MQHESNLHPLSFPFISLQQYPELEDIFIQAMAFLNEIRESYLLAPVDLKITQARLVPYDLANREPYFASLHQIGSGFLEPCTSTIYLKFDEKAFLALPQIQARASYGLIHELAHAAMGVSNSGIRIIEYYTDSNRPEMIEEGLADIAAKNYISSSGIMKKFGSANEEILRRYLSDQQPMFEGFPVREDDVLWIDPDEGVLVYPRLPEMRVLERIDELEPEMYDTLVQAAFAGDHQTLRRTIIDTFGMKVYLLMLHSGKPHEIIRNIIRS